MVVSEKRNAYKIDLLRKRMVRSKYGIDKEFTSAFPGGQPLLPPALANRILTHSDGVGEEIVKWLDGQSIEKEKKYLKRKGFKGEIKRTQLVTKCKSLAEKLGKLKSKKTSSKRPREIEYYSFENNDLRVEWNLECHLTGPVVYFDKKKVFKASSVIRKSPNYFVSIISDNGLWGVDTYISGVWEKKLNGLYARQQKNKK